MWFLNYSFIIQQIDNHRKIVIPKGKNWVLTKIEIRKMLIKKLAEIEICHLYITNILFPSFSKFY